MSLSSFLRALEESGRVKVALYGALSPEDIYGAQAILEEFDQTSRLELAGKPPRLSIPAALWGAKILYRAAQFLVYRGIDAEEVGRVLGESCPQGHSAWTIYSVDLSLRYLPDLIDLARGIARQDPLVGCLLKLSQDWPLSSVGVETTGRTDLGLIFSHPSLRRLYLDRVACRCDGSAAVLSEVREAIRADVGAFPELLPESLRRGTGR